MTSTPTADLSSHHIEGYANAVLEQGGTLADAAFSVPLYSHIEGNLWMGGCKDGFPLPEDFEYVVSLYKWEKYQLAPKTERLEVKMYDAARMPAERDIIRAVDTLAHYVKKGKTLVHCQAGLNRSGLIAATYLVWYRGYEPEDAIQLLWDKRGPIVLCNAVFREWVLKQKP